ncbi:GIY-YIG nuclease family protein [Desulfovibrio inopinatus]|uniref:GIY-YIG nuclease family protein n=1 Tax=Desulfovibrio inopinatus TaxID=102109 RepID=UPI0004140A96|nr:GIY-YIG nuclease family protein [Desulfovibrio inopinatus]
MTWWVYLARCADDCLYCGCTTSLKRRLAQHNGFLPGGARYTASRRPVCFVGVRKCQNRAEAYRLEYRIKRTATKKKLTVLKTCSDHVKERSEDA